MLTAERTGFWGGKYTLTEDGRPVTVWDSHWWTSGGSFDLAGRTYTVKSNAWGSRFTMFDDGGHVVAEAERVGKRNWAVLAGGHTYRFQRPSFLSSDHHLMDGERTVGVIKRTSAWTGSYAADLPGLPQPVQVFTLGVLMAQAQAAAAAAA
ncbi:hypothetical protein [Actinoplanes sp. G11-F43]|uniref:hypothetical protein n=1 Tax=Actinoplanes sp. G11-F43 TaxID=3424130 RepID=UPI003D34756B